MAKKISKKINSRFNPTFVSDYPVYAYGGRMYPGGGFMMPTDLQQQGIQNMANQQTGATGINPGFTQAAGMLGQGLQDISNAKNPDQVNWGSNIGGGALIGAATGAAMGSIVPGVGTVIGGAVGAIGGAASGAIKSLTKNAELQNQQDQLAQQQQEMLKQQTINNLPAQPNYRPTFADGGEVTPKQFTQRYIQSPKYKERLTSSGYDVNPEINTRLNNVNTVKTFGQYGIPSRENRLNFESTGRPYTPGGSSYLPQSNAIVIDHKQAEKLGIPASSIESHEFGHAELGSRGGGNIPMTSRLNEYDSNQIINRLLPTANPIYKQAPDEIKSDLNSLRYELFNKGLYDAGMEDFNKEHLNQINDSYIRDRLGKNYSDEDLIWLMNNIAQNNQPNKIIAAGGGGLSRSEDYGSKKKPYPSVKSGDFAGGDRSYPIPSKADAVDALRLAGLHGRSDVRAKVYRKYPSLKKADGGMLDSYAGGGILDNVTNRLSEVKNGGTHEQSPTNGVPIQNNALVEEGEFIYKGKNGKKYVFTNRF